MSDSGVISVQRQGGSGTAGNRTGEDPVRPPPRRKRNRRGSGDLTGVNEGGTSTLGPAGELEVEALGRRSSGVHTKVEPLTKEDHRTKFYEHYHKEAEEYDKEFLKNREEDLNTTLIFAGLFSAVASAFIIQVQSELQSDPNEETAALLRVLIYKIDNTTFGGDIPTLPQWNGPPQTIIQVQSLLYASLVTSLLSAFIAMLGKQWLNRYDSVDVRGSAIERSRNRQRKLDGIVAWYFSYVMESLPLMLQAALLLLGCALSKYLWEIDTTVASVVISLTSFGVLFYLFVVIAGASSTSCPCQTPAANVIRHVSHLLRSFISRAFHQLRSFIPRAFHLLRSFTLRIPYLLRSFIRRQLPYLLSSFIHRFLHPLLSFFRRFPHVSDSTLADKSVMFRVSIEWWSIASRESVATILAMIILYPPLLLVTFFIDTIHLGRATFISFISFTWITWIQSSATTLAKVIRYSPWLLATFLIATLRLGRTASRSLVASVRKQPTSFPVPDQVFGNQETELDFRCSLWMLQTTLDKSIKVSTLNFLKTILPHVSLRSSISSAAVLQCFDIFSSCLGVSDSGVATVTRDSEKLAGISAMCFLRAFFPLLSTEPTCALIGDVWKRYERVFPFTVDLRGLPCPVAMDVVHHLFTGRWFRMDIYWTSYKLSTDELITVSRALAQAARSKLCRRADLVHFALHFLSQDPFPPDSVIVDCLTIVATELGYNVSDIFRMTSDENARLEELFIVVFRECQTTISKDEPMTESTRGAMVAFVSYAARRKGSATALPASLKYAILDVFNCDGRFLEHASDIGTMLQLWIAVASSLPYSNDVGVEVVHALLKMAPKDNFRQHIPAIAWEWLKKWPILLSRPWNFKRESMDIVMQTVQKLGDLELTASLLFIIIRSMGNELYPPVCEGMLRISWKGISEMGYHADLVQLLDDTMSRFEGWNPVKQQYEVLKSEMDKQEAEILAGRHAVFMCALPLPCL